MGAVAPKSKVIPLLDVVWQGNQRAKQANITIAGSSLSTCTRRKPDEEPEHEQSQRHQKRHQESGDKNAERKKRSEETKEGRAQAAVIALTLEAEA
jgi:hypothetical protein